MSNQELRDAIDAAIKANGNKEITGDILNDILNDVVDTYELRDVTIFNQDSTPTAFRPGDLWYAPTAEQFSIWDGATWNSMTISATKLYQPDGTNGFVYTDNTGKLTVDGDTDINGDLNIVGDIIQTGSAYETHLEQVYTKDDLIITRDGAVAGLGVGVYTGFQAKFYNGVDDGQLVFDKDGWARVGDVGALQKIATIEESPTDTEFAYYDNAASQLQTKTLEASDISDFNAAVTLNSPVIQSKSFVSPSTSAIPTTSVTPIAADLLVAITPKSADSKLRIEVQATFIVATGSLGANIIVQKKVGSGSWTSILNGNNIYTSRLRGDDSQTITGSPSIITQIDSPGISDEIQFRMVFSTTQSGVEVKYTDSGTGMITVDEIEE